MGMTIDEIIKYIPAPICGETEIGPEKQKEYDAHDIAVSILRKYQKIEQIVKSLKELSMDEMSNIEREILGVVEDGNDD